MNIRSWSAFLMLFLTGCSAAHTPGDPFEPLNRRIFNFNRSLDRVVIRPIAKKYVDIVPKPARQGVSNFMGNLSDIITLVNDALQRNGKAALSDAGRVAMNSTLGMFGLFDVATRAGLEKRDADFGQTLGKWGFSAGPYFVIPVLGPTTLRDSSNLLAEYEVYHHISQRVAFRNTVAVLRLLDARARLLGPDSLIDNALDPYAYTRDAYLAYRQSFIGTSASAPNAEADYDPGPTPQ